MLAMLLGGSLFFAPAISGGSAASSAPTASGAGAVATGEVTSAADLPASHRFRSGVVVGFELGAGAFGASGYPNNVSEIGDPNFYSASGWMLGTGESIFVMGALADYVSFGLWYAHSTSENADWRSHGDGGGLRVDAFPLVDLAPRLAGLALSAKFGLGSAGLTAKAPGLPGASGTQSFIGVGVFYEWPILHLIGGHLSIGPSLEYDAIWSTPFERYGAVASARVAFYGGP